MEEFTYKNLLKNLSAKGVFNDSMRDALRGGVGGGKLVVIADHLLHFFFRIFFQRLGGLLVEACLIETLGHFPDRCQLFLIVSAELTQDQMKPDSQTFAG